MYEKHFGLQKRPFPAKVAGNDVFVGPQTARTMTGLRKALQVQDAVVTVTGPAGCGKSTLAGKALEAVAHTHRPIHIGRISLRGTDVLEFVLEELGVPRLPNGPIRQFALLRRILEKLESKGTRLLFVIEDGIRLGLEALAEVEVLTAADAGESGGAALMIMGDERLQKFLQDPQLTRLVQRIRHSQEIKPLSTPELRGYLMHCFRRSGGDFEQAFAADAAAAIQALSRGIPRMANNIAEAAMSAAAASGALPVTSALIAEVAREELGLAAPIDAEAGSAAQAVPEAAVAPEVAPEPVPETEATPEPVPAAGIAPEPAPATEAEPEAGPEAEPEGKPEPELEPERELEIVPEAGAEPAIPAAAEPTPAKAAAPEPEPHQNQDPVIVFADETHEEPEDELPELIQDTLPDLEVLAAEIGEPEPEPAAEPESGSKPESQSASVPQPKLVPEPEPMPEPELTSGPEPAKKPAPVMEPARETPRTEVADWEKDPTLAELRPDLEALEKAMAVAQGDDDDPPPPAPEDIPVLRPETPAPEAAEEMPEITLDNALQQRIDNSLIDESDSVSPAAPAPAASESATGASPEIKLPPAKAKQADAELERIAAELAKAKTLEDVDDKLAETLFGEELSLAAAEVAARVQAEQSANDEELSLFDTDTAEMAQAAGTPAADNEPVPVDTPEPQQAGTEVTLQEEPSPPQESAANMQAPASIEDQITTSMTQTLKALKIKPPVSEFGSPFGDDDEEDEKKGGFFSRFRRS